jgi:hypothetical protein
MANYEIMVTTRATDPKVVQRCVGRYPGFRFKPTSGGTRGLIGTLVVSANGSLGALAYADTVLKACHLVRVS